MHLSIGVEVTCLFGEGRLKDAAVTTVCSEAPLYLDCVAAGIHRYTFPRRVILVFQDEKHLMRGEAQVMSAVELPDGHSRLELSRVEWEDMDRRRHARVDVAVPVSLRAVYESKGDTIISVVDGVTADLSIGGSKVLASHSVIQGSLVEFYAKLSEEDSVRALGIVAHSAPDGSMGIAFLDYVGAAKEMLEEFLAEEAA